MWAQVCTGPTCGGFLVQEMCWSLSEDPPRHWVVKAEKALFSCLKTWLWLLGSQWALCFCVQEQGCQLWRAVFVWALGGRSSAGAELQPAGPGAAGLLSSHCCTHCSPSQHRPLSCRHLQLLTALWAVQGIGNHCSIPPDWCGNLKAIWNQYHHQLHPRLQR